MDYHGEIRFDEVESIFQACLYQYWYPMIFSLIFCNAKTAWPNLSRTFSEARHFVWWHCGASQVAPCAENCGVRSDTMGSTDQEHPPRNGQPDNIIHILYIYIRNYVYIYIYTHINVWWWYMYMSIMSMLIHLCIYIYTQIKCNFIYNMYRWHIYN